MNTTKQLESLVSVSDYCYELELKHLQPATISLYRQRTLQFQSWLEGKEPSPRLAQIYLTELRRSGHKDNTIRGFYFTLRGYLAYLGMDLELEIKSPETLPTYHSRHDLGLMLDVISSRRDKWARLKDRDKVIVKTLAYTGVRRAELLSLRGRDIKDGYLFVRRGKEKKDRVIPLVRELRDEIHTYIHTQNIGPGDRLFPMTPQWLDALVKGYALKAGLEDITPHKLRHYFATRLIERKAELKKVQMLMGHKSIETTAIYLDVVPIHLDETIRLLEGEQN